MNKKEFKEKIGMQIKLWRVAKKLNQEDFAKVLGCAQTSISAYERGVSMDIYRFYTILKTLGFTKFAKCFDDFLK